MHPISLKTMRLGAGYRSARAFAAHVGVPESTYARYEADPSQIPLQAAWRLADVLGCTIDEVVGRVQPDLGELRGPVQEAYDALPEESRARVDDYMGLLAEVAAAPAREREAAWAGMARGAEICAAAQASAPDRDGAAEEAAGATGRGVQVEELGRDEVVGLLDRGMLGDREREAALDLLSRGLLAEREREADLEYDSRVRAQAPGIDAEELELEADAAREARLAERKKRDEEVVARIMEIYDARRAEE